MTPQLGDGLNSDSWDSYCPQLCALPLFWKLLPSCSRHNWTLHEYSFRPPDFTSASSHADLPACKLRGLEENPWAIEPCLLYRWKIERKGVPDESGADLLVPLSQATGWVAACRTFSPIFGNTNTSYSGDPLSRATHQEKKWQNLKFQEESTSSAFSQFFCFVWFLAFVCLFVFWVGRRWGLWRVCCWLYFFLLHCSSGRVFNCAQHWMNSVPLSSTTNIFVDSDRKRTFTLEW